MGWGREFCRLLGFGRCLLTSRGHFAKDHVSSWKNGGEVELTEYAPGKETVDGFAVPVPPETLICAHSIYKWLAEKSDPLE
jgi:hypothetical protein